MKIALLLIAFISLIGVRFIPRSGRFSHIWIFVCFLNLAAVAYLYIGSLRKDSKIRMLESDVVAVREFSSVASLDALGYPLGYGINSDHTFSNDLTRLLEGMYTIKDNKVSMQRGPEAEKQYKELIKKFPKFPFGYYFLAVCLRESGNDEWRDHAHRALEIFKITTRIDGHRSHHDEFFEKVSAWFEEE